MCLNVQTVPMASHSLTRSLRETLEVFVDTDEPLATTEVADRLDLGRRSTYDRLDRLVERGRLETKRVGASARVWWRPRAGSTSDDGRGPAERLDRAPAGPDVLADADIGVFLLDEDFRVVWTNEATERYFGIDRHHVVGRDRRTVVADVVAPVVEDGERFARKVLATDDAGSARFECHVLGGPDHEDRWLEHRSEPITDGPFAGGRVELYYDITERKEPRSISTRGTDQFERLVDAVDEYAIFRLDEGGYVRTWNHGAERIKGYREGEIVGEHFSTFYTEDDRAAGVPERNLRTAAETGTLESEGWRVREDGSQFWASVTISAVRDAGGGLDGFVKVTRDLTDRKERERRFRRERDLLQRVLDTAPVGIGVFDDTGDAMRVNEQFTELLGMGETDPEAYRLGRQPILNADGRVIPFEDRPAPQALATGEPITDRRVRVDGDDGRTRWLSVNATPFGNDPKRVVATMVDVTPLKEQADRLARQRDDLEDELRVVFDRIDDAFFALDENWQFTHVNDHAADLLDRSGTELVGRNVWDVFPRGLDTVFQEEYERAMETQETASFVAHDESLDTWFEVSAYPSESGLSVYFQDVTERKERERELELYETVVETVDDGIYAVDDDAEFVMVNDGFCELTGYDRTELLGRHTTTVHDDTITDRAESMANEIRDGERRVATIELDVHRKDGVSIPCESRLAPFELNGGYGRCGVVRDVSAHLEQERELQRRVHQQGAVADLGQRAIEDTDLDALMHEAAELVATTLDNDYCKVLELDADREELLLRQGVGWQDGIVGSATVSAVEDDSQASYTLRSQTPVLVENLETEARFGGPDLLTDHDVRSGISVVIGPWDDPWGILGTHDTAETSFAETDVDFVQSVANVLVSAIDRHEYEARLVRQREQLRALNDVNRVVNDTTVAVIEQSTRGEIEGTVCERLAETESYCFAWIGEVDTASKEVCLRVEAGVENYLENVDLSIDPDESGGRGPTARAFQTGEMQTVQDVNVDPEYEPWRDHAGKHGYRSSAAIPVVHDGTLYGVLNVYAERPRAFEGEERVVLEQLGRMVGHAIAATERKQALMSDELVRLQFRIPDVSTTLNIDSDVSGTITLDQTVPLSENEFVVYGSATPDAVEGVRNLVDEVPHWTAVTFREEAEEGNSVAFELSLSEPPVLSAVAAVGGSIESASIEDGDYEMTIHLSPTADAKQVIDLIRDTYPSVQLLRRTQITRDPDQSVRLQEELTESLTERQRTVLEMAYHAGFFEWPRHVSGEEMAETMAISSPTFHQHLRKAEQKLLDSLFSPRTSSVG
jgi:PAS domain S-box-containing protein